jgi:hypothetical protein
MSENRLIQLGGSDSRTNDNVAFIRSEQREAALRDRRGPEVTKTKTQILGEQYAALHQAEEDKKKAERARLLAEKKIVVNADGSETHFMRGLQY